MKKIWIFLSVAALLTLASVVGVWACASNIAFSNLASPTTYFYGYTTYANIGGSFWVPGAGDVDLGVGKDSGAYKAVVTTTSTQDWTSASTSSGVPYILIAGSWAANATYPSDTCPVQASDPMTALMYEQTGDGTSGHAGKFVACTTKYYSANSRYNFSVAMSPANDKQFQAIPVPQITAANPSTKVVDITWTQPSAGAAQYYDSTMAAPSVITNWEIFYALGSAPTTGTVASWTSYGQVPYAPNTASLTLTAWNPATQSVFLAMRPVFDKYARAPGFTIPFVSANSAQIGPTGAGVFGPMSASAQGYNINVTWTSNVETGVATYQVYSSTLAGGPFKAVGNPISPLGNGHVYNTSFSMPATKSSGTVFVKVKATKTDTSEEWTDVKKVLYGGIGTAPVGGVPK